MHVAEAALQRYPENMQQIYRRTPMPKCDFNKVECNFIAYLQLSIISPVNLLHIFRTPCPMNSSEWLLVMLVLDYWRC